jgi:hypothetical protein
MIILDEGLYYQQTEETDHNDIGSLVMVISSRPVVSQKDQPPVQPRAEIES